MLSFYYTSYCSKYCKDNDRDRRYYIKVECKEKVKYKKNY